MAYPPSPTPTLAAEINAATRDLHTRLNKLITSRLALALPPHCMSPELYTFGFAAFAEIYLAFEAQWQDIASQEPSYTSTAHDRDVRRFLAHLRPPLLPRTRRICEDLRQLRCRTAAGVCSQSEKEAVVPVTLHRTLSIGAGARRKPHLLLAYAWVMYMAVFSGGRWIRGQLRGCREQFWTGEVGSDDERGLIGLHERVEKDRQLGLSFWNFDGEQDGEDIKAEFKQRLGDAETLLTLEERAQVVEEAKRLFEYCVGLVAALDGAATGLQATRDMRVVEKGNTLSWQLALAALLSFFMLWTYPVYIWVIWT